MSIRDVGGRAVHYPRNVRDGLHGPYLPTAPYYQGTIMSSRLPPKMRGKKRRPAPRRNGRNSRLTVPRNKIGFPQSMRTQLRYCDAIDFTPSSATINVHSFLANGLFKPDVSATGHQPRGFDEFMDVYKTFTVKGSKIAVTWSYEGYMGPSQYMQTGAPQQAIQNSAGAVQAVPAMVGMIIPTVEAASSGTIIQNQEVDKARWVTVTPVGEAKTVSAKARVEDFFGKDALTGSEGYTGSISSDPSEKLYYHVCSALQHDEYPITIKLRANIVITYDTVFTEPKYLPVS